MLTTIAPNLLRLGPIETRHPDLSRNINFEENGARKCLQTAAQILDQKLEKRQNSLMRWQKWEAMCSVPWYTTHSLPLSFLPYKYPLIFCEK